MVTTGKTVKNNAKRLYGAILRFSEAKEPPDWLNDPNKILKVKKLTNSQLSLTYTTSGLQELLKQDGDQVFSYDQVREAIAFLSEFLVIFHRPKESQQGQTQTAAIDLWEDDIQKNLERFEQEYINKKKAKDQAKNKDPWCNIRKFVPTEFELLDTDFYEKRQGENVPILNLPSAAKNWTLITQGNYIDRDQQEDFFNLAQELKSDKGISFLLIEGKPGAGKTALMKWLTYQLSQEGEIVLQLKGEDYNWLYLLSEFSDQIQQQPIYLMVDDLFRDEEFFLRSLEDNDLQFPLIIIGTTRINENQQERAELAHYQIKGLTLELNSEERERFLQEIRHKDKEADQRLNQLSKEALNKVKNAPTLLVLMLQLSEGKPFDQIIADVIKKLPNQPDYPVYPVFGVICAFYQHGTVVYPDIIKLCLPNFSQDSIDNVINIGLETDLKGLVQKEIRSGYEGLTAIHQDIAYYAIQTNFKRRNNENLPYHQGLVEKYLRISIPQLESNQETHQRWFAPQLRSLMIYNQKELVNKILGDFSDKIQNLQMTCSIKTLIYWQRIYFLFNLQEDVKRCINLIIEAQPNDNSEYQYRLSLIEKVGTKEDIKEAIIKTETWLKSHLDNIEVRRKYLTLIGKAGQDLVDIQSLLHQQYQWIKQQSKIEQCLWDAFLPVLYHHGKVEDYAEMIQLALQQYPDNHIIISSIFGYYRDYLDYETCFKLADFLQFAKLPVDKWQNKVHAANFFRDYGELKRAERLYRRIIGNCYQQIRENQNVNILKKTLDYATLNYAYYLLLINPSQWNSAIQKLQGLLSKNPKHSLYNLYLAKAYAIKAKHHLKTASKSKKQAIEYYQKAIQYEQQKTGYFWYEFGLFYREMMRDLDQAKHCFQQSLHQKINLPACVELAEIEQQLGNIDQAKTLIKQALSLEMLTRPEKEQKEQLIPRIERIRQNL